MILRTLVRDCLQINWAVPLDWLEPPPPPLSYQAFPAAFPSRLPSERVGEFSAPDLAAPGPAAPAEPPSPSAECDQCAFVSALLFHHEGARLEALPAIRFSYPQFHLRFAVWDGSGEPAVWFRRILVPFWVVPGARLLGRQPARAARLEFDRPSRRPDADTWRWRLIGRRSLAVTARRGATVPQGGPTLGPAQEAVRFFRERRHGYVVRKGRLRRLEVDQPVGEPWPVRVEVDEGSLVAEALGQGPDEAPPPVHSAWILPELQTVFEIARRPEREAKGFSRGQVPAAGAWRRRDEARPTAPPDAAAGR